MAAYAHLLHAEKRDKTQLGVKLTCQSQEGALKTGSLLIVEQAAEFPTTLPRAAWASLLSKQHRPIVQCQ